MTEAVFAPTGTDTEEGIGATVELELVNVTVCALGPTGPVSVTVTVTTVELPPTTEAGLTVTVLTVGASSVNVTLLLTPYVPVTVQVVLLATADVVAVTVPLVLPAAMVIEEADSVTAALGVAVNVTTAPDGPAAAVRVAVIVTLVTPPTTAELLAVNADSAAGVTVRVADPVAPPLIAPMLGDEEADTALVETVNVADVLPDATVTEAGTVADDVMLDVSATTSPADGAAMSIVTVPVELVPPATEVGFKETAVTLGVVRVKAAEAVSAPTVAPIVAVVLEATAVVVNVNVAVVAPAATVTEAGTDAAVLEELRVTLVPPLGAAAVMVTVPVTAVVLPPSTVFVESPTDFTLIAPACSTTNPSKFMQPQPVTGSHPAVQLEVLPFGSEPFVPDVMSVKMDELPLNEYRRGAMRPYRCLPAEFAGKPPVAMIACSAAARLPAKVGDAPLVPPMPE